MLKKYFKAVGGFCQKKNLDNTFGFKAVATQQKQPLVNSVFHSVANKYDLMNDVMSLGVHRWWKNHFVQSLGNLSPPNYYSKSPSIKKVLDVAGGTGDIAFKILNHHHYSNIKVTVLDINQSMLDEGKKKAKSFGLTDQVIEFVCANAQELPFQQESFDAYTISFGLRNVPRTLKALKEANRILKHGGRFMCLQFSKVENFIFRQFYKQYSFNLIPKFGELVAGDKDSYAYLVESIEKFLSQQQLISKMEEAGFQECTFQNLTNGIVAIHSGYKFKTVI